MYQKPTTRFLLFIYFTEQSECLFISQNNLKCKIFASCPKNPTQKRRNGKKIFSSLLVSSRFDFPNQKSKVESLSGGNNRSWKSTGAAMKFQWNCKSPIQLQIRVSPNNRTVLPRNCGFLTSVNQFSHLNIWIWEIEWGWSFFGTSSPENWKSKEEHLFTSSFSWYCQMVKPWIVCKYFDTRSIYYRFSACRQICEISQFSSAILSAELTSNFSNNHLLLRHIKGAALSLSCHIIY